MLFVYAIATGSGPAFGWTACVYHCGWGYLAVASIAAIVIGIYVAYRKPPNI